MENKEDKTFWVVVPGRGYYFDKIWRIEEWSLDAEEVAALIPCRVQEGDGTFSVFLVDEDYEVNGFCYFDEECLAEDFLARCLAEAEQA